MGGRNVGADREAPQRTHNEPMPFARPRVGQSKELVALQRQSIVEVADKQHAIVLVRDVDARLQNGHVTLPSPTTNDDDKRRRRSTCLRAAVPDDDDDGANSSMMSAKFSFRFICAVDEKRRVGATIEARSTTNQALRVGSGGQVRSNAAKRAIQIGKRNAHCDKAVSTFKQMHSIQTRSNEPAPLFPARPAMPVALLAVSTHAMRPLCSRRAYTTRPISHMVVAANCATY